MVKKITKGEVFEFVRENLVTANDRGLACGDGRYEPEQSRGAIRAFGADMGILMAIEATLKDSGIKVSPQVLVDKYAQIKKDLYGDEAVLDYHCDEHNHEKGTIGCGHIAQASKPENDGEYGSINHEDVQELFDAFTSHQDSNLTILNGEHKEVGVLIVKLHSQNPESRLSVNSKNKKGKSFFVLDETRTDEHFDRIIPMLASSLEVEIDPDAVKKSYSKHVKTTSKLLKAAEKPHFVVIPANQKGNFTMEQLSSRHVSTS